ncbi:hypothetical protein [Streptomyces sp. NPDC056949]|uniref:hypothetical protein n=1 Tax=Streptomyces sp. NPDC056949 TaxID=3345976 RepID=UPI003634F1D6
MPSALGATGPRSAAPPSPTEWPALIAPKAGADHYLEVGFGSGSLAAGASTGEIQLGPSKTDGANVDEADDYSRATNTASPTPPSRRLHGLGPRLGRGVVSGPGSAEAARYLDR